MKVIGITEVDDGHSRKEKAYVAIITHREIEKVADKARYIGSDRVPDLKVGDEYPIDEGHDFRCELTGAIQSMDEAYRRFSKVASTAGMFAGFIIKQQNEGNSHED